MSDPRKIMQGRQVSSHLASQQFRAGNNAAINGFAASSRSEKASQENLSRSLHSEARAYERSGWQQEKLYQIFKKNALLGKK
jgi:hypothetical protein